MCRRILKCFLWVPPKCQKQTNAHAHFPERRVHGICVEQKNDAKSANFDYDLNSGNREENKNRSIRKQFFYEYLIQNYLVNFQNIVRSWSINSEFWLPIYIKNLLLFTSGAKYIDNYVKLTGVNIMKVNIRFSKMILESWFKSAKQMKS